MLWLKLLLLLYADDTVIMSDCPIDFQRSLDAFNNYCTEWHLKVNLQKPKILIFGARNTYQYNFLLGNQTIDIDTTYIYLGVEFITSGSFLNARKHIAQQAKKALYLFLDSVGLTHFWQDQFSGMRLSQDGRGLVWTLT